MLASARGFSNAALYQTGFNAAVPEPSAWALFILGFGVLGGAMRTQRRKIAYS